jgi:hypothetical protein
MTIMRLRNRLSFLAAAALLVGSAAWADPPARVGRINLIQGSVAFMAADTDEWTAATVNYPLTAGDCLWTEASSRAEAHVGSTAIRLGPGTELGFLELDETQVRIRLAQGLLSVRLRELDPGESFAIDTPAMSVALLAPGSYRIELTGIGDTRAIVSQGRLEAVVDGLAYPVGAGQAVRVAGSGPLSLRMGGAPARDAWDRWCAERDESEDHLASLQYVPRSMVGCEDLDWYGSWSVTVEFGPVWAPHSVPAGWAPYRFGRWAWVQPWGWTWIDELPWGFAPFHYGRWALMRGRWIWVPGSRAHRPVYAPALVTFAEAVANGPVRWFPLGPREPYVPAYPASRLSRTQASSQVRRAPEPRVRVAPPAPAVPRRESAPTVTAAKGLLGAITQLVREWSPGHSPEPRAQGSREPTDRQARQPEVRQAPQPMVRQAREPEVQKGREPKTQQKWQKVRRKKVLANGQSVWVEELAPAE